MLRTAAGGQPLKVYYGLTGRRKRIEGKRREEREEKGREDTLLNASLNPIVGLRIRT